MPDSKRAQLGLRLDSATMQRLEELSQRSGTPITTVGREIMQHALKGDANPDLIVLMEAVVSRLAALEQRLSYALPALHDQLATLEQLICTVDANAVRRRKADHARHRYLWGTTRYGVYEIQNLTFHVLEYAMASQGHSRAISSKLHADSQEVSTAGFKELRATADEKCAEIDAGAPAAMQPPARPRASHQDATKIGRPDEIIAVDRNDDPEIVADQPNLFDAPGNSSNPAPKDGRKEDIKGEPTSSHKAGNGRAEVVP